MIEEISGDFLQWLRGFFYVAEKGSVRQAAAAMGREQPTISRQIRCLEKELGVTLFDRSSGKMEITNEGKILREEAISLFEDIKKIKGNFNEQKRNYQGKIVVATTHVIIDRILPLFVEDFRRQHPGATFHFEAGIREDVYEMVQSGVADFGISFYDTMPKTFVCHDLWETGLVLLAPRNNNLFKGAHPTLKQIAKVPLILFSHRGSLEPLIEGRFHKEGLKPNVVMTHNNFVSIREYVARGMGVAIVGGISVFPDDEQLCDYYSLDRYFPKRIYGIILKKKKYLSEMVKAFIQTIDPNINFSAKTKRSEDYPLPSHTEFLRRKWGSKLGKSWQGSEKDSKKVIRIDRP